MMQKIIMAMLILAGLLHSATNSKTPAIDKLLKTLSPEAREIVINEIDDLMRGSYSNGYLHHQNTVHLPFVISVETNVLARIKANGEKLADNYRGIISNLNEIHAIDKLKWDLEKEALNITWKQKAGRNFWIGFGTGMGSGAVVFGITALTDITPVKIDLNN